MGIGMVAIVGGEKREGCGAGPESETHRPNQAWQRQDAAALVRHRRPRLAFTETSVQSDMERRQLGQTDMQVCPWFRWAGDWIRRGHQDTVERFFGAGSMPA